MRRHSAHGSSVHAPDRRIPAGGGLTFCAIANLVGLVAALAALIAGADWSVALAFYLASPPPVLAALPWSGCRRSRGPRKPVRAEVCHV